MMFIYEILILVILCMIVYIHVYLLSWFFVFLCEKITEAINYLLEKDNE